MQRTWAAVTASGLVAVVAALGACGNDQAPTSDGEKVEDGTSHESSHGDDDECLDPAALEQVAAGMTVEGIASFDLALDGDSLFFSAGTRVFRVDAAGGEPELLYESPMEFSLIRLDVYGDQLVVLDYDQVLVLPKTGGEPTTVASLSRAPAVTDADVLVDRDNLYLPVGDPSTVPEYFAVNLREKTTTQIARAPNDKFITLVQADEYLYVADGTGGIYRFPKQGGDLEPVEIDWGDASPISMGIAGVDERSAFLSVTIAAGQEDSPVPDFDRTGVYRVPLAGGTPELLIADYISGSILFFSPGAQLLPAGDVDVLVTASSDGPVLHKVSVDGGELSRWFCLATNITRMTADAEHVYVVIEGDESDRYSIVRAPLQQTN